MGKTSTFNHLFHTNLRVSNETSVTRSVDVYSAKTENKTLKFNVVDTPGLEDTSGLYQDACNMHALQTFRKNSIGSAKLPNIIVMCVKSTDNRDRGPQSAFVRNIRTLESLKLIDQQKPNVVIVVTHACAIAPGDWNTKTQEIIKKYQEIMFEILKINVPVVFIENNFDGFKLEKDGRRTGTLLPDKTVQPSNLFNVLLKLLKENGDKVASRSLEALMHFGLEVSFRQNSSIRAKILETENLDESCLNYDEQLCLSMLQGNSEAHKLAQDQFKQVRLLI